MGITVIIKKQGTPGFLHESEFCVASHHRRVWCAVGRTTLSGFFGGERKARRSRKGTFFFNCDYSFWPLANIIMSVDFKT